MGVFASALYFYLFFSGFFSLFILCVFVSFVTLHVYYDFIRFMDLKLFINMVCAERGILQRELSEALGWSPQVLTNYVCRNSIGRSSAKKLADYLGCDISDIPGTKFYKGNKSAENPSEVLNNVENSFTHKSFLTIKCPCCGKNVVISALCVSKIEDLEE